MFHVKHGDTANADKTEAQKKILSPLRRAPQAPKICTCSPGRRTKATEKKCACRPALRAARPAAQTRRERNGRKLRRCTTRRDGQARRQARTRRRAHSPRPAPLPRVRAEHKPYVPVGQIIRAANCLIMPHYKTRRDSALRRAKQLADFARIIYGWPTCPAHCRRVCAFSVLNFFYP